ncbi:hypothetical protein LTR17_027262 [Elasticomyces elasticus]|nr:hypothetical protein LTR17_027262 [Elasticomyces elasticus]
MTLPRTSNAVTESTEVIICGGGPTGALLSALLGQYAVANVVLEREPGITTDPRGIALDEDGIRCMQAVGMYNRIHSQIASCHKMLFISGSASNLHRTPFLTTDMTTSEGNTGHVGFVFHKQPELERALRDAIDTHSASHLRTGCSVQSVCEDPDRVTVEYTDAQGANRKLRGAFLVGADGKTGYVRKRYLEPKGVDLERCEGCMDLLPTCHQPLTTLQHQLRRELGGSELAYYPADTESAPRVSTLEARLHTGRRIRPFLSP